LLKAASLSKSTFYFEINKPGIDIKNEELIEKIKDIFIENKKRYGVRRVTAELHNQGIVVNHKKVQRIMNKFELKATKTKIKYHSYIGEVGHIADNIINRDFEASKPNEKWTTDVSQFNCPFGKAYLSPILDMYGTDIVAWDLSLSPNLEQTKRMLDEAFRKNPNIEGLVFHSDMGWQYQHNYYQERLKEKGIIQSMSRKGNCIDNCIMETFFGTLKREMFYGHEQEFQTFEQLYQAIAEYIDYYNNRRIKGKTKWMPPVKFREASMLAL
jgi:transposase InsO family protein